MLAGPIVVAADALDTEDIWYIRWGIPFVWGVGGANMGRRGRRRGYKTNTGSVEDAELWLFVNHFAQNAWWAIFCIYKAKEIDSIMVENARLDTTQGMWERRASGLDPTAVSPALQGYKIDNKERRPTIEEIHERARQGSVTEGKGEFEALQIGKAGGGR
jgi:hypothetical protein